MCEEKLPAEINTKSPPSQLLCCVYLKEEVTVGGVLTSGQGGTPSELLGVCVEPVLHFQERGGGIRGLQRETLTGLTSCRSPDGWPDSN